jgi:uncharacterized membrane protein HdeD (DUF308 family)
MNKETDLRSTGVVGILGGSATLYLSGTTAEVTTAIIGAVFVLAGLVAILVKKG